MAADRVIMGRLRTTRFDNEDDLQPLTYLAAQILENFFGLGGGWGEKKLEDVSNEQNPGCLGYIGIILYTRLRGDKKDNKPWSGSLLTNQYDGK